MSNLISVDLKYVDPSHNSSTSVNGACSDDELRAYFVGAWFDKGVYPVENMQKCISIEIHRS